MTIMGVISVIGIGALLASRDDANVDAVAESFLTEIREAQNNAIAIKQYSDYETKAWLVEISPNNDRFFFSSFYKRETTDTNKENWVLDKKELNGVKDENSGWFSFKNANVVIEKGVVSGGAYSYTELPDSNILYVVYTTPFGTPHVVSTDSATRGCEASRYSCEWKPSDKPSQEWEIRGDPFYYLSQTRNTDQVIRVTFSGRGKTRSVIINSSGDAYIE